MTSSVRWVAAISGSLAGALVAGGCGPRAAPAGAPPSSRAPALATLGPTCDAATLTGFDAGLAGAERTVARRAVGEPPLPRRHARPCAASETDAACEQQARREVLTADPAAAIVTAAVSGGVGAGVLRDGARQAVVRYEVPVPPRPSPRMRWEAVLRSPTPPDVAAALTRVIVAADQAGLEVVGYEADATRVTVTIACP